MTLGQAIESGIYARDKEIARLKKELTEEKNAYIKMYNMYVEKDNIINELEKYLIERIEYNQGSELQDYLENTYSTIYSVLQELKGSEKE